MSNADPFVKPIVSPIMVGRDAHLAALRRCLDEALAGAGQTVLVAGEAGIGKSRLVGEAAAYARDRGMRVLTGQCFEPDHALPYAPIRDLIRSHLLRQPWANDILAAIAPDLGGLLPELSRLQPGSSPMPQADADQDRRRIVHACTRLVDGIAAETPLLLIVEDAHWSDEASLDLLIHLARHLRGGPDCSAALVVTYRGDEVSPQLAATLAAFDRERLAAEARLGPLPRAEVLVMLRAMSDHRGTVSADLADAIYRLSEGNPFFIEELLRSALVTDEPSSDTRTAAIPLPRGVAESVRRRVDRLSDGARATLTVAAISGRRFDFALLEALSGCTEADLLDHLKELIAAKLVVEESADRFAFRHALMRQAVDDGLLARERRALHRQALEAIPRVDPHARDHQAADLARHAVEAGAWAEALELGQRAGEQALALYAPGAAIELLGYAIDAAARLGVAPPSSLRRSRGLAHETRGDFGAARADYEAAVALARAAGNQADESEALLSLGGLWAGRDYEQTGPYVRQALDLARTSGDRALLARALNRLGNYRLNMEEATEAFRLHEEALTLVEQIGDRRGIAETLDLLGMARYLAGDLIGSAAACRRAIPLLREIDDRRTLVNALATLSFTMDYLDVRVAITATASHEERQAIVEEAIALAREIDGRSEEALAHCCAALLVGERRVDDALDHAGRALRIAEEIGHRQWNILAHVAHEELFESLLDLDAARRHLDAALAIARDAGSSFWVRGALSWLAALKVRAGDLDGAEQTLAETLDDDLPMLTALQREAWFARARIVLARRHPAGALAIVDRLIAAATPEPATDLARLPHLAQLRGEALAALGRPDEALAALDAARDGAAALEHRPLLWRIHLSRATFFRDLGRRVDADDAITAAHAAVASFAADIADVPLRDAFLQRANAHLPPPRVPTPRQVAKAAYGGLTARERDVAALIAAGHSNRQIADALFISEPTAATHVGNILGKLGVKTRAQVAAWAQERGLTSEISLSPR
ncbi:MAG: helix-turn-helix transcriptional regulator [Thermomicrobiales bacterium]